VNLPAGGRGDFRPGPLPLSTLIYSGATVQQAKKPKQENAAADRPKCFFIEG